MPNKSNDTNRSNRSRREILQNLASVGSIAVVGTSIVSAEDSGSEKSILFTFDPRNPEEVRGAYRQLISLPDKKTVVKTVKKLTEAQVTALRNFGKDMEVVTNIEMDDGTQYELSSDSDSVSVKPSENTVTVSSAGEKTIKAVSKLKNQIGTTEATFRHFVHWEYNGTKVMNESHWKTVGTGILYNYDGLSTNYLNNRGDEAVSRMVGDFSSCLGGPCVTKSLGTEIWMFERGGWTVNEL